MRQQDSKSFMESKNILLRFFFFFLWVIFLRCPICFGQFCHNIAVELEPLKHKIHNCQRVHFVVASHVTLMLN